jgi:three-Cys-motif partner protein
MTSNANQRLSNDGLLLPSVGKWAARKYELLSYYCDLFATSMLNKWDSRVYIDLFAGSGKAKVKGTNEIILTSPLLAIDIDHPFDKYIYCDDDKNCVSALKSRVIRDYPNVNVEYIQGDSNANASQIIAAIPRPRRSHTVLSFCFVDPFSLNNLRFDTIRTLSRMYMDFLVLIPAYMDAQRNVSRYIRHDSQTVELFLGASDWRPKWNQQGTSTKFGSFISEEFGNQMSNLGYSFSGLQDTVLVREPTRNLSLYRLSFFSRSPLGQKFWREARKHTRAQLRLF